MGDTPWNKTPHLFRVRQHCAGGFRQRIENQKKKGGEDNVQEVSVAKKLRRAGGLCKQVGLGKQGRWKLFFIFFIQRPELIVFF